MRRFSLIHSYTLECGYHSVNTLNTIANLKKHYERKFTKEGKKFLLFVSKFIKEFLESDVTDINSRIYRNGAPYFTTEIYKNLGKSLLVALLDIMKKNPISRLPFTRYKSLKELRLNLSEKILRYDKFGRLMNCPDDLKKVSHAIEV